MKGKERKADPIRDAGETKHKKIVFDTSEANMLLKIKDCTFESVQKPS